MADDKTAAQPPPPIGDILNHWSEVARMLPEGATLRMPDGTEVTALADERTIQDRLAAILGELPAIGKDAFNAQQNFHYRSHDDVLNALNPLLAKHGVVVVPYVLKRVPGERSTSSGKTMYEVNLHVQYEFHGLAGDSIAASAWGEGTDMGDKATNKAMTGAFKNVLAQVFAVSTAESFDGDAGTPEETTRGQAQPKGRSQRAERPAQAQAASPPGGGLLPGAITGEGYLTRLAEAFRALDPTIDWTATMQPGVQAVFGVESRDLVPEDRKAELWRRVSNAEVKLRALFPDPGEVGGTVDDAAVLGALQWAFDGAPIDNIVLTETAQRLLDEAALEAAGDDPPFGDTGGVYGDHLDKGDDVKEGTDDDREPAASD